MRRYSWILVVFIMVLCIGFGFAFPDIIFSRASKESTSKVEKYQIDPVELGNTNTVMDAMRSCVHESYVFDYQEDMANLSKDKLIDICNYFMGQTMLEEYGFSKIEINESKMNANCYLAILDNGVSFADVEKEENAATKKENMTVTTVLWTVESEYAPGHWVNLTVDDRNEKVVQAGTYFTSDSVGSSSPYYEGMDKKYRDLILFPFLEKYYGVTIEVTEKDEYTSPVVVMKGQDNDSIGMYVSMPNGFIELSPSY